MATTTSRHWAGPESRRWVPARCRAACSRPAPGRTPRRHRFGASARRRPTTYPRRTRRVSTRVPGEKPSPHGTADRRPALLRHTAPATPGLSLVSPPVAPALDVFARILAEIGRADDEDLEALRPG